MHHLSPSHAFARWPAAVLVLAGTLTVGLSTVPPAALANGETVPTTPDALLKYLGSGHYRSFEHESKPRPPSQGSPHGTVQTYLNPILANSLRAKRDSHPVGAAAVKELYGANGQLRGWSVMVKTRADSNGGKGWYWYEIFSTREGSPSAPAATAPGTISCASPTR
jgi:hypothetical protein